MFDRLTPAVRQALGLARAQARRLNHSEVSTGHVLYGLALERENEASRLLNELGCKAPDIAAELRELIEPGEQVELPGVSERVQNVLERSFEAVLGTQNLIDGYVMLGAVLAAGDGTALAILRRLHIDPEELQTIIEISREEIGATFATNDSVDSRDFHPSSRKKTVIDEFSTDLTALARQGSLDPVIGRVDTIERVVQVISRRTKNNPVLVGEPGVGKSAIIEGLAQRIASGDVPETLREKRIISIDIAALTAGTRYRGDFEERITQLLNEIQKSDDVIVFIDEIHTLAKVGKNDGSIGAADMFKPYLAREGFACIGATTFNEYRAFIEKDSALERRFQPVEVPEPSNEETLEILQGLRDKYENHHNVYYEDEAIRAAVELSRRYITDRFLPDKAIDLLDEAGARARMTRPLSNAALTEFDQAIGQLSTEVSDAIERHEYDDAGALRSRLVDLRSKRLDASKLIPVATSPVIGANDIAAIIAASTGINVTELSDKESVRLLDLEKNLSTRVIGQSVGVSAVAKAVRRRRTGLGDPNRPAGNFIFAGPTGVGKTELAKALAAELMGDENALITLDMSEYSEKHTVSRMIGSPPGYVGHEEGGQLTERVRRRPYSVVLFDEIEKAHPDVFNTLLQVLEEGRLTDSLGRAVDFTNTVIIFTSNLGSAQLSKLNTIGFSDPTQSDLSAALREIKIAFRPEFLNRIDEIVVFNRLTAPDIRQIVDAYIRELENRLRVQSVSLEVSVPARDLLARLGFDQSLGARPLRRTVQRLVENPVSELLLHGVRTDQILAVEAEGESIVISIRDQLVLLVGAISQSK